jgi:hypothetical protein
MLIFEINDFGYKPETNPIKKNKVNILENGKSKQ